MKKVLDNFWKVAETTKLTHLEVHLYFKLLDLQIKEGAGKSFFLHNIELQSIVGTRVKNLIKARKKLNDCGLITVKSRGTRKPVQYIVPNLTKESNNLTKESKPGNHEPQTKAKDEVSNMKWGKKFDLSYVDNNMKPLVLDFLNYRKDIGKPFKTDKGVRAFYERLTELSSGNFQQAKKLIKHAEVREWMTVYPIKNGKRNKFRNESVTEYDDKI